MVELLRISGAGSSAEGSARGAFARSIWKRFSIGTSADAIALGQRAKAIPFVALGCTAWWISCAAVD